MKKEVKLFDQVNTENKMFSGNEILSSESMKRIFGGDGGEDIISIPPPPRP